MKSIYIRTYIVIIILLILKFESYAGPFTELKKNSNIYNVIYNLCKHDELLYYYKKEFETKTITRYRASEIIYYMIKNKDKFSENKDTIEILAGDFFYELGMMDLEIIPKESLWSKKDRNLYTEKTKGYVENNFYYSIDEAIKNQNADKNIVLFFKKNTRITEKELKIYNDNISDLYNTNHDISSKSFQNIRDLGLIVLPYLLKEMNKEKYNVKYKLNHNFNLWIERSKIASLIQSITERDFGMRKLVNSDDYNAVFNFINKWWLTLIKENKLEI